MITAILTLSGHFFGKRPVDNDCTLVVFFGAIVELIVYVMIIYGYFYG